MYLFRLSSLVIMLHSVSELAAPLMAQDTSLNKNPKLPPAEPTNEPDVIEIENRIMDKTLIANVHLHSKEDGVNWRYAAGINLAWSIRKDYGARTFRRFEPEAVGYIYSELPWNNLWLRHGARFGFSNDQPQMPRAVRIEETDWKFAVEEGVIWNWYIAPSLSIGAGYDWRTVRVRSSAPVIASDSRLNSKETFLWSYVQAGIGIPALNGSFELQPTVRWQNLPNDSRTSWAFGFEVTKAW